VRLESAPPETRSRQSSHAWLQLRWRRTPQQNESATAGTAVQGRTHARVRYSINEDTIPAGACTHRRRRSRRFAPSRLYSSANEPARRTTALDMKWSPRRQPMPDARRRGTREQPQTNFRRGYTRGSGACLAGRGVVAHRVFTDRNGRVWEVWDVAPTLAERRGGEPRPVSVERRRKPGNRPPLPDGLRQGWLAFESAMERRRVAPVPPQWEIMSDEELDALLHTATPRPRPRRLIE
jgi:hypothetical protein